MDYRTLNQAAWDQKTPFHWQSSFYDVQGFLQNQNSLREIELALLGELQGQQLLHLQCHFGQDTLSLARKGAKVTGLDFSPVAIAKAQELAQMTQLPANFVCCDVYETAQYLPPASYDLVFTSYGTIGWLPDLSRWATVIAQMLRPQGRLVFVEFHPMIWTLDDQFERFGYDYFNTGVILETSTGTYADRQASMQATTMSWNHSLSDVINSLIQAGLRLDSFNEYPYSPYACFPNLEEIAPQRYRFAHIPVQIPMTYSLVATKI